jgi:RHS repeat-associated protein
VWGDLAERTGNTPTPHQFVGALGYEREADSGLMHLGFRYYDPSLGRFISQDPIGDGDNWYIYAGNDPVNYVDPLGLARVEVRFKQPGGIGPSHAYIIVSENDGSNPYMSCDSRPLTAKSDSRPLTVYVEFVTADR